MALADVTGCGRLMVVGWWW